MANGKQKIWATDVIGEDYKLWKNEFVILDCGTGRGKSYFCLHALGTYAKSTNKKVLYLCNRSKLKRQIFNEVKSSNLLGTIYVTSYQMFQKKIQDKIEIPQYDYIVADECHYFTTDASFNEYTDVSYDYVMKQNQSVVLFISATAKTFFRYLIDTNKVKKKNSYRLDKDYSYVKKLYYYQSDELASIINDILENEQNSKVVVFCNVGDRILEMNKIYRDNAHYYCSKTAKDSKLREICGWKDDIDENDCVKRCSDELITFDKRILFTTSVLDNGVDLKDENIKHIFTEIIDLDTMIQSLGRKRSLNDDDTCTFYIREYQKKGIQGFINQTKWQLDPVKEYKEDYKKFYNEYGNGKNRYRLNKNKIFYSFFGEKNTHGKIKINDCRYSKYNQDFNMFSAMKEFGHIAFLECVLEKELVEKAEPIVVNVEQIDAFMEFLKLLEGKKLFSNDREFVKEEFRTTPAIKLTGKNIGISTLNGQLGDLYDEIYPYRFYNKDKDGNRYVDKRRKLKDGSDNPNRDKTYWILENRSPPS